MTVVMDFLSGAVGGGFSYHKHGLRDGTSLSFTADFIKGQKVGEIVYFKTIVHKIGKTQTFTSTQILNKDMQLLANMT